MYEQATTTEVELLVQLFQLMASISLFLLKALCGSYKDDSEKERLSDPKGLAIVATWAPNTMPDLVFRTRNPTERAIRILRENAL